MTPLVILRFMMFSLFFGGLVLSLSDKQLYCESKGPEYNISYDGGLVRVIVLPISVLMPDSRKLNLCPCYHRPYNDHCISIKDGHESCRLVGKARRVSSLRANINRISLQGVEERPLLCVPSYAADLYRKGRRRRGSEVKVSIAQLCYIIPYSLICSRC